MHYEMFRTIVSFYGEKLLAPPQNPSWKATPCRLSTTAYSAYSLLASIPGGRSSIDNLRTCHAEVKGTQEPQYESVVLTIKSQNTTKHEKVSETA